MSRRRLRSPIVRPSWPPRVGHADMVETDDGLRVQVTSCNTWPNNLGAGQRSVMTPGAVVCGMDADGETRFLRWTGPTSGWVEQWPARDSREVAA